ncbi:MAG: hypothetical protein HY287_05965 [Planctomycetes bacterium]|nr:hypothetical protein [Planctomycetota bacterium]MBI3833858.1 hypothetical protein [Planctomycetota bacterium]
MTVARGAIMLAIFSGIALAVVHLRGEETRCAARILSLEARQVTLRRELWSLQSRTARLRTPERVRDRVASFQTGLIPPGFRATPPKPERIVSVRK